MFCKYCGAPVSDNAKFCPACGRPRTAAEFSQAASPPRITRVSAVPGSVPKQLTGRRVIYTTRSFTHEELLRFLSERWDSREYNEFVTDPSMSQYTKLYIVLPATTRYMVILYSGGALSKTSQVVLSIIKTPAGAGELMMRAIPTQNAIFGIARIANTMSARAEREGPTEEILQKYADYTYALLKDAGFAR